MIIFVTIIWEQTQIGSLAIENWRIFLTIRYPPLHWSSVCQHPFTLGWLPQSGYKNAPKEPQSVSFIINSHLYWYTLIWQGTYKWESFLLDNVPLYYFSSNLFYSFISFCNKLEPGCRFLDYILLCGQTYRVGGWVYLSLYFNYGQLWRRRWLLK